MLVTPDVELRNCSNEFHRNPDGDCTSTNAMNHILLDGELDVTKKGLKTTFGPS